MPNSKQQKSNVAVPTPVQQLALTAGPVIIVTAQQLLDAWHWIVSEVSARPQQPDNFCIYDKKSWANSGNPTPLEITPLVLTHLAHLYLTSQAQYAPLVRALVNDGQTQNVILPTGQLDSDVRGVISNEVRFRNSLSEHLAFWTSLATLSKVIVDSKFMCSLPNVQPEDKGPDGLFIVVGTAPTVEIHSVKNSINNPHSLISSQSFRNSGIASPKKQLDDFWRKANQAFGLIRLGELLDRVAAYFDLTFAQEVRTALLADCSYNAIVVADDKYANLTLFEGYERITNDVMKRIATYIGSSNWKNVAAETRIIVQKILGNAGVL